MHQFHGQRFSKWDQLALPLLVVGLTLEPLRTTSGHKEAPRGSAGRRPKGSAPEYKVSDSAQESRCLSTHHVDDQQKCFFQSSPEDTFLLI